VALGFLNEAFWLDILAYEIDHYLVYLRELSNTVFRSTSLLNKKPPQERNKELNE